MRDLISFVNDNHVDNNLKEILVYVYFGSIVNNQPKKQISSVQSSRYGNFITMLVLTFKNGKAKDFQAFLSGSFVCVCVEVLRPSQPNGVMSSTFSLPNQ